MVFKGSKVLSSTSTPTSKALAGISLMELVRLNHIAPHEPTIDAGYIKPSFTGLGISSGPFFISSRTITWTSVSSSSFKMHFLSQNASAGGGLEVLTA
jgi:hypothetical protein